MNRVYLHTRYERFWHWMQALVISLLLLTGLEVHAPSDVPIFGFVLAIQVHNWLGFILLLNAFLGLFYALSTGSIQAYLPEPKDFVSLAVRQARYYLDGIFKGAPHPVAKSHKKRLNPLQKLTYLAILNLLLPLQMLTGVLMWAGQKWPAFLAAIGGLEPLAAIHTLAAWLFFAFLLMHIYLTTTAGPRWLSGIIGMITGWEELEDHDHPEEKAS